MRDVLVLEPLLFPAEFTSHRTRILVNDVDVVAVAYPPTGFHGFRVAGFAPSHLLRQPEPAIAPESPTDVSLGGSDTTENRLTVRIRREGPDVVWDRWRLIDMEETIREGPEIGLGTFRFDVQAYRAEIARAARQAERTWPARSVAELLRSELWPRQPAPDGGTWIRSYGHIRAPVEHPDTVMVAYHARDLTGQRWAMPGQYIATFPVDDTDPGAQARAIIHRLSHEDLKPLSVHVPRRPRTWSPEPARRKPAGPHVSSPVGHRSRTE